MNKNQTPKQDSRETRFSLSNIELRADDDKEKPSKVVGYAAMFNKRSENFGSDDYPFFEVIAPGAFADVLNDDVRAVIDHSGGLQTLARTKSGTLQLSEDTLGLRFEFEAPDTTAGRDIVTILQRGDIDQASFSFNIAKGGDSYENKEENGKQVAIRTITKVGRLYDVSPVTYPAYPDTIVQSRSAENFLNEQKEKVRIRNHNKRARTIRLHELETNL